MSSFFIERPIFAWVLAILVMMAGTLSLFVLPVAQYPEIASPQVTVSAKYPGASARTVEETVTQVIEQQISGIDKLLYMSSTSDSNGQATITFTFENGTDIDIAQVQVQNKLQLATPMLPDEVQRQGISVTRSSVGVLLISGFYSADASMSTADLGDYVGSKLKDALGRLPGVGSINFLGAQYAMRIWCDPQKFHEYKLNPSDVVAAVRAQNSQTTGGQAGAYPTVAGQQINITVNASSRLTEVGQFEDILLRTNPDGSQLRLRDVARVELNGETFNTLVKYNGHPAIALQFLLASGANSLDTARGIKSKLEELSRFFPPGLKYVHTYDTTPFVEISILAVFKTIGEAIVLVFLVMYLFLQSWRATLIPTIAIPVVLLGTFGVMNAAGFSINTLTMFGMALSIGLLVDDAIVVVENVERLMQGGEGKEGLGPKQAAFESMRQITGALVGVAAVIAAVFVPMAFMPGSVGIIYRQFSLTIVTSMGLSALVALSLTPALCATLLRPHAPGAKRLRVFRRFNDCFDSLARSYRSQVAALLARPLRGLAALGLGVILIGFMYQRLPSSFLPNEDQGAMYVIVQLPPGASLERTRAVLDEVEAYLLEQEASAARHVMTMAGSSFNGSGHNLGQAFVSLRHWDERRSPELQAEAIFDRTRRALGGMPDARVTVFGPAPVKEMARAAGFEFELMDLGGRGHEALMEARDFLLARAAETPLLRNVRHGGLEDVEQYALQLDLDKAGALSLEQGVINDTVAAYWGSVYINDFMDRGRTKKVYLQADAPFRMQASDFEGYHVRNARGEMVPFASFLRVTSIAGSPQLERYEGVPAVKILGEAAPGHSSGEAMAAMEALAAELPDGFGYLWTGMSYQERQSGSLAWLLYALSLAVVFLCLAALYESWTIPLAVLMVVPTGVIGALAGVFALGMSNDVYFQIGVLAVVGLSAKNSILIVEFARELRQSGLDLFSATIQAARIRLRPIIMTSMAFTLGVLPLALSSGAGSGAQNAVGATVVCGVIAATLLGIYCAPLCFVFISGFFSGSGVERAS